MILLDKPLSKSPTENFSTSTVTVRWLLMALSMRAWVSPIKLQFARHVVITSRNVMVTLAMSGSCFQHFTSAILSVSLECFKKFVRNALAFCFPRRKGALSCAKCVDLAWTTCDEHRLRSESTNDAGRLESVDIVARSTVSSRRLDQVR